MERRACLAREVVMCQHKARKSAAARAQQSLKCRRRAVGIAQAAIAQVELTQNRVGLLERRAQPLDTGAVRLAVEDLVQEVVSAQYARPGSAGGGSTSAAGIACGCIELRAVYCIPPTVGARLFFFRRFFGFVATMAILPCLCGDRCVSVIGDSASLSMSSQLNSACPPNTNGWFPYKQGAAHPIIQMITTTARVKIIPRPSGGTCTYICL